MQAVVVAEQGTAPGRGSVEGKRGVDPLLPPVAHRRARICLVGQVDLLERRRVAGEQFLSPGPARHQAQGLVFIGQYLQGRAQEPDIETPHEIGATADVEVRAVRPGALVEPDLELAERKRQLFGSGRQVFFHRGISSSAWR